MTFYVFSRILNLQIHAHIYRSFIRHHKMLGVRIAKRKIEPQKPANPCDTRLCSCIFSVNTRQKEVQTRCLCLNTRSVFLTIEAGIPRIAVDNLWNTGRQVRGPTFSVSILFPVKADALFLPPFTLSPPKSPRSNGICIAFLRSAMECGNVNMLRFDEYGRMEVIS